MRAKWTSWAGTSQWLIFTGSINALGNTKAVANCERTRRVACDFGKGNHKPDKKRQSRKILPRINISGRIIFCLYRWCLQITISRWIQVGSTKKKEIHIHIRCSQVDVFLKHDSGYMGINHQVVINTNETVK